MPNRPGPTSSELRTTSAIAERTDRAALEAAEAPKAAPPAGGPACAAIVAEQAAGLREVKAIVESLDPLGQTRSISEPTASRFGTCIATHRGAWGFALHDVKSTPSGTTAHLTVIHADPSGHLESAALHERAHPRQPLEFVFDEGTQTTLDDVRTFDFDGDGEEELLVSARVHLRDGRATPVATVLSMSGGHLVPYAPARNVDFFEISDADNDGRPDLLTHGPFHGTVKDSCDGSLSDVVGPVLLAHALADGTFSYTDAAATTVAKNACPEAPTRVVSRIAGSREVDETETANDVACARLWGTPPATVLAEIARECRPLRSGEGCSKSALHACRQAEMLRTWARARAPLRLKETTTDGK
jgi:hypothetical protein